MILKKETDLRSGRLPLPGHWPRIMGILEISPPMILPRLGAIEITQQESVSHWHKPSTALRIFEEPKMYNIQPFFQRIL